MRVVSFFFSSRPCLSICFFCHLCTRQFHVSIVAFCVCVCVTLLKIQQQNFKQLPIELSGLRHSTSNQSKICRKHSRVQIYHIDLLSNLALFFRSHLSKAQKLKRYRCTYLQTPNGICVCVN